MILKGRFYEFHKERIVSRPGAPLASRPGLEIGPDIPLAVALSRVRAGKDVYTLAREDAKQLALQVGHLRPEDHLPHRPSGLRQIPRDDVYDRHFHPSGDHPNDPGGFGHVFYGERGEGLDRGA